MIDSRVDFLSFW